MMARRLTLQWVTLTSLYGETAKRQYGKMDVSDYFFKKRATASPRE